MIRSALAVLAGIVVLTGTSFASRSALVANVPERAAQPRGDQSHLPATLFQLAYTLLCIAAGGYVTGVVGAPIAAAPRRDHGHDRISSHGVGYVRLSPWSPFAMFAFH
jgi:hypothetical protein